MTIEKVTYSENQWDKKALKRPLGQKTSTPTVAFPLVGSDCLYSEPCRDIAKVVVIFRASILDVSTDILE